MGKHSKAAPPPSAGLYDELVTARVADALKGSDLQVELEDLDAAESHHVLARHLARVMTRVMRGVPEKERAAAQMALVRRVLAAARPDADDQELMAEVPESPGSVLTGLFPVGVPTPSRPLIALSDSALLVNGRGEPRVGEEVRREIESADRVDLLCAFIKWFGLRVLEEPLESFLRSGRKLRVITTTYLAATEPRPLQWLAERGAEVKVSYDTDTTRLHAKAWLFHRDTGFSTAYVGSSNLSKAAMLDGVEWNVRLSQRETPHILDKFSATFDTYWNEPTFEPYDEARLSEALRLERSSSAGERINFALLDVHALPHQREILQALDVERERHDRWRNLVVAATGTGKTVIAALDYARLRASLPRARLLFVAHRKELLAQSLSTFRAVMKDGAFGELFVDGHRPEEWEHVFASVQSLSAHGVGRIDPDAFDVVIIDEFHHAAAKTYRDLLERLQPRVLVGLTATPERSDGQDITQWFGGHIAAELRLWDALERGLLSPFQYFGVHDDVDLSAVRWSRGGYDRAALERVYTGNDIRVAKVLEQLRRRVPDVANMRALGFCVGVEHARYMAERFRAAGIRAAAISADTPDDLRDDALRKLRDRELSIIFAVDLFNEGVDVPQVDTVLFLRPTESATLFQQQLGRGLRRADNKPCLTVLDFIGAQRDEFRFAPRFAGLLDCTRGEVERHVENGFPFLPAGCHLELDRVASQIVLENLRGTLLRRDALVAELREGHDTNLASFLRRTDLSVDELYRNGRTFSGLRRLAGLPAPDAGVHEEALARGVGRQLHVDDPERLDFYRRVLGAAAPPRIADLTPRERRMALMLHFGLRGVKAPWPSLEEGLADLWRHPALRAELVELFGVLNEEAISRPLPIPELPEIPIQLHARYERAEVLAAFDHLKVDRPYSHVAGVLHAKDLRADLFFVTLKKTEKEFSATTMYRDYALGPALFHWESQGATAERSDTGQRYIHHEARGDRIFLFVRRTKADPFVSLGPCTYVTHQSERPIAFTWRLKDDMPEWVLREARVAA